MKIVFKTDVAKKLFEKISTSITSDKITTYQSMYCKNNSDGTIYVRAMDKSHVLELTVNVESDTEFDELYVPFFEINKFLPKFKSENIIFEVIKGDSDNDILKVTSGRSYCKTSLVNCEESPNVNEMLESELPVKLSLTKKVLSDIKNKLSGLVSTDNNRPVLSGVCLDIINGTVNFASSDGKKLAVYNTNISSEDNTMNKQFIIPVSIINTVCSINTEDNVEISCSDKFVLFSSNGFKYFGTLITGAYPPYQKIVSATDKNDKTITVNRNSLVDALSFVNVNFDVTKKCQVKFSDNKLAIDYDNGANHEEFDVEYDGEFDFLVNSQFLEKMVKPLEAENVIFKFASPTEAILIEADSLKMILMPLKSNR